MKIMIVSLVDQHLHNQYKKKKNWEDKECLKPKYFKKFAYFLPGEQNSEINHGSL